MTINSIEFGTIAIRAHIFSVIIGSVLTSAKRWICLPMVKAVCQIR
ncbi:hypothetical protein [Thalassotalea euphylliae]|nr:hypothetical protein [Thalassotalea euphylliae]